MKRTNHTTRRVITTLLATMVLAAVPSIALAQTGDSAPAQGETESSADVRHSVAELPRSIEANKERIFAAIKQRLETLDQLSQTVASNDHITADHATRLQNEYREVAQILEEARGAVEEAETAKELREAVSEAFSEALVFPLRRPKTRLVLQSHSMVAKSKGMAGFGEHLESIMERLAENGHDMAAAQAALDGATSLIDEGRAIAAPVAENVIDLDPKDWPDSATKSALNQGHTDLQNAKQQLKRAQEQIQATVSVIKETMPKGEETHPCRLPRAKKDLKKNCPSALKIAPTSVDGENSPRPLKISPSRIPGSTGPSIGHLKAGDNENSPRPLKISPSRIPGSAGPSIGYLQDGIAKKKIPQERSNFPGCSFANSQWTKSSPYSAPICPSDIWKHRPTSRIPRS